MSAIPYCRPTIAILWILSACTVSAELKPCPTFEAASVYCDRSSDTHSSEPVSKTSGSHESLLSGITTFIHANRVITLTNDHSLITASCRYIGQETLWSKKSGEQPFDAISRMAWHISVLQKHPGNYLLANFNHDSFWSYEC